MVPSRCTAPSAARAPPPSRDPYTERGAWLS